MQLCEWRQFLDFLEKQARRWASIGRTTPLGWIETFWLGREMKSPSTVAIRRISGLPGLQQTRNIWYRKGFVVPNKHATKRWVGRSRVACSLPRHPPRSNPPSSLRVGVYRHITERIPNRNDRNQSTKNSLKFPYNGDVYLWLPCHFGKSNFRAYF